MIFDKIKQLLADQLGIDAESITMDTNLDTDLDCDSIDKAELVTTLEDEYETTFDYEKVMSVKTVGDVVRELEKLIK